MEKHSIQTISISIVIGVAITVASGIILDNYKNDSQADFQVSITSLKSENNTTTSIVKIKNSGSVPARELTAYINPRDDVIVYSKGLQMEKFELGDTGPRAIFVDMPRLASGAEISIINVLNVTKAEKKPISIFIVSDQGSKIFQESSNEDKIINVGISGIIGGMAGYIIGKKYNQWLKKKSNGQVV